MLSGCCGLVAACRWLPLQNKAVADATGADATAPVTAMLLLLP